MITRLVPLMFISLVMVGCAAATPPTAAPTPRTTAPGVESPQATVQAETTWTRILSERTIRVGFTNEPPFSLAEPERISGADPEVLRAVMADHGVENLEGVLTAFSGLIPGLLARRFDIIASGVVIRPARCAEIAFGEPTAGLLFGLATRTGNPLDLHSFSDIAAHPTARIGVIQASVDEGYATQYGIPQDRIIAFPEASAMIDGLRAGRVDAVVQLRIQLATGLAQANDPNFELVEDFEQPVNPDGSSGVAYLGVGIRHEDTELLDAYNQGLAELKQSGELLGLIEPFGFTEEDIAPDSVTIASLCPQ